jgi:4-amino-4-deoxychorismate lyase
MPAQGTLRDGTAAGLELIETLRWEPGEGFVRLERHLARLQKSAEALGLSYDGPAVREVLQGSVRGGNALRVRLTLAQDGTIRVTNAPFEPLPADAVWMLRIAGTRLESTDPLVRHKTTRRQRYEAARAEFSREEADEVLLANERGEICEGTITNVFADFGDGVLATPALDCGLLPGVLRGELLETGKAREAVLTEADLRTATSIYVGNSLRGLIRARLA